MPSPFPGMNPYLEQSLFWSEFHNRLIIELSNALIPSLRPKYYIGVEERTYTIKIRLPMPAEVRERYLEVREVGTNTVVTVIEILSPKNKRKGKGRTAYENKRQRVLGSLSHLVEIDLLRGNLPMPMTGEAEKMDYRIVISRAFNRPVADLYGFSLPEAIPNFPLPLKPEDEELVVNLQDAIARVYDFGSYDVRIDYRQPVPPPALSKLNQQWVDELLAPLRGA